MRLSCLLLMLGLTALSTEPLAAQTPVGGPKKLTPLGGPVAQNNPVVAQPKGTPALSQPKPNGSAARVGQHKP
jgi:hypothetical protein